MFVKNGNELWGSLADFGEILGLDSRAKLGVLGYDIKKILHSHTVGEKYVVILNNNGEVFICQNGIMNQIASNAKEISVFQHQILVLLENGDLYVDGLGILEHDIRKISHNYYNVGLIRNNGDFVMCGDLYDRDQKFTIIKKDIIQAENINTYLKSDNTFWYNDVQIATNIERFYYFCRIFFILDNNHVLYDKNMVEIARNVKHMDICCSAQYHTAIYILTYDYEVFNYDIKTQQITKILDDICQIGQYGDNILFLSNSSDVIIGSFGLLTKIAGNVDYLLNYDGPSDLVYPKTTKF